MNRRGFIVFGGAAGVAAMLPGVASAQAKVPRVAIVDGGVPVDEMQIGRDLNYSAFLDELAKKGFVEGKTVIYDRYQSLTGASTETMQDDARRILATSPDVIAISGSNSLVLLLKTLAKTTPMVVGTSDFIATGIVSNIAHPEANVTGWSVNAGPDFEGKMLSILAEAVPAAKRFGYANSGLDGQFRQDAKIALESVTRAAARLGLTMVPLVYPPGGGDDAWKSVMAAAQAATVEMVFFGTDTPLKNNLQQVSLANLALAAKMPTLAPIGSYAESGGLIGYGANYPLIYRGRADYTASILNGAHPGDLAVMQPTVFDFVVNQKTAKAIDVTIPTSTLSQATEVIQ